MLPSRDPPHPLRELVVKRLPAAGPPEGVESGLAVLSREGVLWASEGIFSCHVGYSI